MVTIVEDSVFDVRSASQEEERETDDSGCQWLGIFLRSILRVVVQAAWVRVSNPFASRHFDNNKEKNILTNKCD